MNGIVKFLLLVAQSGIAIATFLILMSFWRTGSWLSHTMASFLSFEQPAPQVDVRSLVVEQVQGASELTTAIYTMESVVPASRDRTLGNYVIGKTTLLYIAYGEVRAGVDLSALQPTDVSVQGNQVQIQLPPPEILDHKIDVTRSQVYDYDRGFLGLGPDVAPQLQDLAQRETLQRILTAACENGILEQANDRAETVVTRFLLTSGYRDFSVITQPTDPAACAESAAIAPSDLPEEFPSELN
ncbi:MAG: DUF4230 domain-containing protein [Synechococcales bacterium]|nr:DUF4230 domain-containing protein [Synechococcales bacterium]